MAKKYLAENEELLAHMWNEWPKEELWGRYMTTEEAVKSLEEAIEQNQVEREEWLAKGEIEFAKDCEECIAIFTERIELVKRGEVRIYTGPLMVMSLLAETTPLVMGGATLTNGQTVFDAYDRRPENIGRGGLYEECSEIIRSVRGKEG